MPNWCEGKLKIRGKKERIISFIENGTRYIKWEGYLSKEIKPKVETTICDELKIKCEDVQKIDYLHIIGTRRNFLVIDDDDIYVYDCDKEEQIVVIDFKAAWGIDAEVLKNISKEYEIDLKIYAFECGMEFNQDIEIIKGKIIRDSEINFNDYTWECIFPELGG